MANPLTTFLPGALGLFAFAAAHAAPALPPANEPVARGLAIAEESDARYRGWSDLRADMLMVLTSASGEESQRELTFKMLERPENGEGNWSLMVFRRPRDIDGTALLTHAHMGTADDQWLYLPALKRVKRISSANQAGPFVGSEFAFEDFATEEIAKFTFKWLRDESCGTLLCHVIERRPKYENSGYTRQLVWIDTTDYQYRRIDYYDRKDAQSKTLTYSGYQLYLDRFWRPKELAMRNLETGKTTKLVWQNYEFKTGLGKSDFTTASLERSR